MEKMREMNYISWYNKYSMWRILQIVGNLWMKLKSFVGRRPILSGILGVVLLFVIYLLWLLFRAPAPEYITATVKRGDLIQKVEAVGTVTSDHDLNFKFPTTGIVEKVLVKEGDKVTVGQELAALRNSAYSADIASAAAQLQSAQASLRELEEGTRPEDIAIAEAEVANKRAALDAAKADFASAEEKLKTSQEKLDATRRQANTSLAGYIATAGSTCSQQIALAKTALRSLDDIFIDATVDYLASQYSTTAYTIYKQAKNDSAIGLDRVSGLVGGGFSSYESALDILNQSRTAVLQTTNAVQQVYEILSMIPLTSAYTSSSRETYKGTVATQKAYAQGALSALDSAVKTLRDASASYDTSIATEENTFAAAQAAKDSAQSSILTYQTALQTQEAQLALKRAGPRETSIDVARASVNSAYASLSRARARLEDTMIRAPTDGVITKVDFKLGEFTGDPDNIEHSITMLGNSPYRVEMYLSEVDIPKVMLTQSGSIELDAFPGTRYALRVIGSEPGPTKIEGVFKYLVTLAFAFPHEEFKIGMTGDGEIYTGERKNVLMVPSRAIIQNNGNGKIVRILQDNAIVEKPVVTGMESDTDTEIVTGLTEGETVVVLIKK